MTRRSSRTRNPSGRPPTVALGRSRPPAIDRRRRASPRPARDVRPRQDRHDPALRRSDRHRAGDQRRGDEDAVVQRDVRDLRLARVEGRSAPTYNDASAGTRSPGSMKIRVAQVQRIRDPTVTITTSGCRDPFQRRHPAAPARAAPATPCPDPSGRATSTSSATGPRPPVAGDHGHRDRSHDTPRPGTPPRSVRTAHSARTADARIPPVHCALRRTCWSRRVPALPSTCGTSDATTTGRRCDAVGTVAVPPVRPPILVGAVRADRQGFGLRAG